MQENLNEENQENKIKTNVNEARKGFLTKHSNLIKKNKISSGIFFVVAIGLIAFNIPGTPLANTLIVVTTLLMIFAMIHYGKERYNLPILFQFIITPFPKFHNRF